MPVTPSVAADRWSNVTAAQHYPPPGLVGASLAYDAADNYVILFGGCTATRCPAAAQTWKYAGGQWTNLSATAGSPPPARAYASMGFDSRDGYVVLFGGLGAGGPLNDTWSFSGGLWHNLTNLSSAPPARYAAAMAFDHADNFLVLFGGCGAQVCPRNDTWQFLAGGWKNVTALAGSAPSPRFGASFAFDAGDNYGLLFGGCGRVCPLGDTYEFSRGRWVALAPAVNPPARSFAALTYASVTNETYLFGGNAGAAGLNDTWRFTAGRWSDVTASLGAAPSLRYGVASLSSTETWTTSGVKRLLPYAPFYGGANATCPNCTGSAPTQTWILEPTLSGSASALPSVVEVGETASFSGSASGGSPPYAYLWQFGDATSQAAQSATHAYASPGSFSAGLTATDQAGVSETFPVAVSVVAGPTVRLSVQPTVTDVGRPVSYSGSVTGGTPPYAETWSFGDLTGSASLSTTHAYGAPGSYDVQLHATDSVQGYGDAFGAVTVHPLPTVQALPSTLTPTAGAAVTFSATVSGGTGPFAYRWTFGDNASNTSADTNHTYANAGTFRASVLVTDAVGGSSQANLTLDVGAAGGAGGSSVPIPVLLFGAVGTVAVVAVVAGLLLVRRRRRTPPTSLAAAPADGPSWVGEEEEPAPRSKRALRRDLERFYRRRT